MNENKEKSVILAVSTRDRMYVLCQTQLTSLDHFGLVREKSPFLINFVILFFPP